MLCFAGICLERCCYYGIGHKAYKETLLFFCILMLKLEKFKSKNLGGWVL